MMESVFRFLISMVIVSTVSGTFSPTVTFDSCAVGPVYTFTVTGAASTSQVFVVDQCGFQSVTSSSAQTFTFNAAACSLGTIPALDTAFELRVQEYASYETGDDKLYSCTCTTDLDPVIKTVSITVSEGSSSTSLSAEVTPSFTATIVESNSDTEKTTGTVGDDVRIKITVTEPSHFFFKVSSLKFSDDSVTFVSGGCTQNSDIVTQPGLSNAGDLYVALTLIRPSTSATVASASLSLKVGLTVCKLTACSADSCGARRRRSDDDLDTNSTAFQFSEQIVSIDVLPPGQSTGVEQQTGTIDDTVCITQTSMIGLMLGLCLALLICACISICLFCMLRTSRKKSNAKSAYSNNSYKA